MKTRIQNPLYSGKESLPNRSTASLALLPALIALTLLGLISVSPLKAQGLDYEQNLKDFGRYPLTQGGTNNTLGINNGGAAALAGVWLARANDLKAHAAGNSLGADTLYGTASLGGSSGQGTVFALNTDSTGFTVLHNFTGGSDGGFPTAGLILSSNTLYGTTVNGGNSDDGTVFAVDTTGGNFKVLHHFTARSQPPYTNSDGGNPYATLILSSNTLYGTASDGGSGNAGTVFALNIITTNFTVLHHFTKANFDPDFNLTNSDGTTPNAQLVLSGATLYGTASYGGSGVAGTVFAVKTNGANFTILHTFSAVDELTHTNSDGVSPVAGLILSGGTLYGTAFRGGNANSGTVFAVNTNGSGFTNLYSFTGGSDGFEPASGLVLSSNTLFGTTRGGGNATTGNGTVFALNTNGTGFTVLYSFTAGNYDPTITGSNLTNSDGAVPQAGLVFSDNTLYGTTSAGGNGGNGTVFSLSSSSPPQLTILGITLSGTNLVINGANGQPGTYVTRMSTNLSLSLNQWLPVATNILNASGNFTLTATNAVNAKAPQRFYILQNQ